jgi:hypothetical protein
MPAELIEAGVAAAAGNSSTATALALHESVQLQQTFSMIGL